LNSQFGHLDTNKSGAVDNAVEIFYKKVLADERVRHLFHDIQGVETEEPHKKLLANTFISPETCREGSLCDADQHLNLSEEEFYAVVEHLSSTLAELGLEESDIAEVADIAESIKLEMIAHDL